MDGFLRYKFTGIIFGRAHTWRGLFSELCGNLLLPTLHHVEMCKLYGRFLHCTPPFTLYSQNFVYYVPE